MSSTVYDVRLRYLLDDRASGGTRKLTGATDKLARSMNRAKTALLGYFGGRAATKALIGFNSNMEQARIQMAGLLKLNTGGSFNSNLEKSNQLVARLQDRAKKSVGTTQDMVKMASMLTRPVTAAGLGMKELEDITAGAAVAARAFNISSEQAALDIEQALAGTLGKKDRFARALLEPMGFSTKSFNKMSAQDRAQSLKKAFNQKSLKDMAKAQANTFAGQFSTFQDAMQRFLGKVGMPVFKAITKQLQKWNQWAESNQERLNQIATTIGEGIVTGMQMLGKTLRWIYDNRAALIAIGLAFKGGQAGFKGANFVKGYIDTFKKLKKKHETFSNFLSQTSVKFGIFGAAIGAAIGALYLFARHLRQQKEDKDKTENILANVGGKTAALRAIGGATDAASKRAADRYSHGEIRNQARHQLVSMGIVKNGKINYKRLNEYTGYSQAEKTLSMNASSIDAQNNFKRAKKFREETLAGANKVLQGAIVIENQRNARKFWNNTANRGREFLQDNFTKRTAGKDVNITINKIEVESNDPDRFVVGLERAADKAKQNPTAARSAFRGL